MLWRLWISWLPSRVVLCWDLILDKTIFVVHSKPTNYMPVRISVPTYYCLHIFGSNCLVNLKNLLVNACEIICNFVNYIVTEHEIHNLKLFSGFCKYHWLWPHILIKKILILFSVLNLDTLHTTICYFMKHCVHVAWMMHCCETNFCLSYLS